MITIYMVVVLAILAIVGVITNYKYERLTDRLFETLEEQQFYLNKQSENINDLFEIIEIMGEKNDK